MGFVTSTGVNRVSREFIIGRTGPLHRVKSVLDFANLVLRDGSWLFQMCIFESFYGLIFHRYSMNLLKSRGLRLSTDHSTNHHGCAEGYIFTHILNKILL